VLNANQTVDNYWMRALPNFGNNNSTFEGGVNLAILRYSGAENRDPTTEQQKKEIPLLETELHPAVSSPAPGKATPDGVDADFTFTFGFNETAFKFNINGSSYAPPSVPVLLQILSGAQAAQDLLPQGSVYEVERNKTVQINMPSDLIGGPHPFHMHGVRVSVFSMS
jgi:iron transport multicopper oxidase